MKEGETRNFVVHVGEVELIHCGRMGIIAHFKGDDHHYSNGYPTEAHAMNRFLTGVAMDMRRRANELRELADKLDGRKLE